MYDYKVISEVNKYGMTVSYKEYIIPYCNHRNTTDDDILPLYCLISETLLKCRYQRFSIYKNDVGNFKQTFRIDMLKNLIKLKLKLVALRKRELEDKGLGV